MARSPGLVTGLEEVNIFSNINDLDAASITQPAPAAGEGFFLPLISLYCTSWINAIYIWFLLHVVIVLEAGPSAVPPPLYGQIGKIILPIIVFVFMFFHSFQLIDLDNNLFHALHSETCSHTCLECRSSLHLHYVPVMRRVLLLKQQFLSLLTYYLRRSLLSVVSLISSRSRQLVSSALFIKSLDPR